MGLLRHQRLDERSRGVDVTAAAWALKRMGSGLFQLERSLATGSNDTAARPAV